MCAGVRDNNYEISGISTATSPLCIKVSTVHKLTEETSFLGLLTSHIVNYSAQAKH